MSTIVVTKERVKVYPGTHAPKKSGPHLIELLLGRHPGALEQMLPRTLASHAPHGIAQANQWCFS